MMEHASSVKKFGSTRTRLRCEECRTQKKACQPIGRDWTKGEKCERCARLGLSCGPNVTAKEQKERSAQLPRRDADGQGKHETHLTSFPSPHPEYNALNNTGLYRAFNYSETATQDLDWSPLPKFGQNTTQSHEFMPEQPWGTNSHKSLDDFQGASRQALGWLTTNFEQDEMRFDGDIRGESSTGLDEMQFDGDVPGESSTGLEGGFKKSESNESEIFDLLGKLGSKVTELQYYKTIPLNSQDANQNRWLYSLLQMLQKHVFKDIKLIVDKVESFADEANCNGRRSEAYMGYTRLSDVLGQIGEQARRASVLTKLAKLCTSNRDDVQAGEVLRTLLSGDQSATSDQDERKTMLAESYTKKALRISRLSEELGQYLSPEFGNFNLKTPCPAFHLAVRDKVPVDVISKILFRPGAKDALDVLHRPSIHMAIELDRQDIVKKLVQETPTCVHARDSCSRTPLQLAVELPCEHRTNSQFPRTTPCPRSLLCNVLLSRGADIKARNSAGCPTDTSAARAGCPFVCQVVFSAAYRTDTADRSTTFLNNQSTRLQAAVEEGHEAIVEMLLLLGDSPSEIRQDGKTAHVLAKERGYDNIARQLEQALKEELVGLQSPFNAHAINAFMGKE